MRSFDDIFALAADRHGGPAALEQALTKPLSAADLANVPDDRWLAQMTKCIFQSGFNWKVIDNKWDGFEAAFEGFDLGRWVLSNDDDIAALVSDKRIVRNGAKIATVPANARFFAGVSAKHGGVGRWLGEWPVTDQVGLLDALADGGSRLGGATGQYFLRFMGKDSFVLSRDVIGRLIAEGVIDKEPNSKSAMAAVQAAFNEWRAQSGRSMKEISRTLAMSIG